MTALTSQSPKKKSPHRTNLLWAGLMSVNPCRAAYTHTSSHAAARDGPAMYCRAVPNRLSQYIGIGSALYTAQLAGGKLIATPRLHRAHATTYRSFPFYSLQLQSNRVCIVWWRKQLLEDPRTLYYTHILKM